MVFFREKEFYQITKNIIDHPPEKCGRTLEDAEVNPRKSWELRDELVIWRAATTNLA
jgi:hypothetical protein